MEQFVAYDFDETTFSSPTSEQSPGGLAVNAQAFDGSTFGDAWVGQFGEPTLEADIASASANPSTKVLAVLTNASDAAVIEIYAGPQAGPRTLLATLSKCAPSNFLWVGFASSTTPITSWSVKIADDGSVDPIEVYFAGFATRRAINGGDQDLNVGREAHDGALADLSTHSIGQTGADFTSEQVPQFTQAWTFAAHEDTVGLHRLERAWDRCLTVRPVLSCFDVDTFTKRRRTVLGLFTGSPFAGAHVDPGMMVSGTVTVLEMVG